MHQCSHEAEGDNQATRVVHVLRTGMTSRIWNSKRIRPFSSSSETTFRLKQLPPVRATVIHQARMTPLVTAGSIVRRKTQTGNLISVILDTYSDIW
jgi:hypothetical protein